MLRGHPAPTWVLGFHGLPPGEGIPSPRSATPSAPAQTQVLPWLKSTAQPRFPTPQCHTSVSPRGLDFLLSRIWSQLRSPLEPALVLAFLFPLSLTARPPRCDLIVVFDISSAPTPRTFCFLLAAFRTHRTSFLLLRRVENNPLIHSATAPVLLGAVLPLPPALSLLYAVLHINHCHLPHACHHPPALSITVPLSPLQAITALHPLPSQRTITSHPGWQPGGRGLQKQGRAAPRDGRAATALVARMAEAACARRRASSPPQRCLAPLYLQTEIKTTQTHSGPLQSFYSGFRMMLSGFLCSVSRCTRGRGEESG